MAGEIALTVKVAPGADLGTIAGNSLDVVFEAGDSSNKNKFKTTGKEVVLIQNVAVAAKTVTFKSVADERNRKGDITAYSLGASEFMLVGPFPLVGWADGNGEVIVEPESVDVKFLVIRFP
jgi:hypothetical protein